MHIQTYRGVDFTGSSDASLELGNVLSRVYREDQGRASGLFFVNRFGIGKSGYMSTFVEIGRVF